MNKPSEMNDFIVNYLHIQSLTSLRWAQITEETPATTAWILKHVSAAIVAYELKNTNDILRILVRRLLEKNFECTIWCDGDLVDNRGEHLHCKNENLIMEDIDAVEDCEILVTMNEEFVATIETTRWNEGVEQICDYTCGPISAGVVRIIEELYKEFDE